MEYVVLFLLGTLISWVMLLIVVPIAQKLADFSLPPWPQTLWKLAVVAAIGNFIALCLDPVFPLLGWAAGLVAFWVLMVKWFEVRPFGALIIVVVSWVVRAVMDLTLRAALASAI